MRAAIVVLVTWTTTAWQAMPNTCCDLARLVGPGAVRHGAEVWDCWPRRSIRSSSAPV